jgi:hypothetical protein
MRVSLNLAAFRQTTVLEYTLRFLFGGAVTATAGIIANRFGPGVGGLFLAFPAIFPATATLLEKHQKEKRGPSGARRARNLVGLDAAGAACGGVGLIVFAVVVWLFLPRYGALEVLTGSCVAWLLVSFVIWRVRKTPKRALVRFRKSFPSR